MRIVCQKCSAAYAIDDKFVTAKGVRAQCPRCRHLQLVKKDEAPAAAALPAPPPAKPIGELHFGQAPIPPSQGTAPAPFAFDFGSPPPPPPPSAGFDFSALQPPPPAPPAAAGGFDFGGLQPITAPPPPSAPPPAAAATAAMLDFADDFPPPPPPVSQPRPPPPPPVSQPRPPPPQSAPPRPPAMPLGNLPLASTPAEPAPDLSPFDFGTPSAVESTGPRCKSCGKVLTDAFDQALGTCDECRAKDQAASSMPTGPDSQSNLVEHVEVGAIHARTGQSRPSLVPVPPSAPAAAPIFGPPVSSPAELKAVKSAMRAHEERHRSRTAGVVAGLLLVVAVVGFLVVKRPWVKKAPPLIVKGSTGTGAKPIEGIIQQWRLNYPELQGANSKETRVHVDQGEELLMKDTTRAYLDAEEEFQKALVLDPTNDRAVAGWVLSIAFGHGALIDEPTAKAAESMLLAAEQRSGDPRVFVAHAHLMIARNGNPNDIKILAERGKNSSNASDKALADLALGQTFLTKNPQEADSNFRESLALDPKLKRSYFFQAQLFASQGKYKEAIDTLERRLQLDKDQWEAAEELARLYIDVGELAKARKVLENAKAAAPNAGRPRLDLAILAYQHLGEPGPATEQLLALVADQEVPKTERADAWVHLAVLFRLGGELQKAADAVDNALEVTPESVPARLQKFLVLIERGRTSDARMELEGLKGKLNDKQLEGTLEGRLLIAENHFEEAMTVLGAVAEADPRRVEALLLAGAAAAKARKEGRAWDFCLKKGLHADPFSRPVPSLTHLYVRPADLLKPAVGAYEALSPRSDEDPNPSLCEGLVAWYSEDLTAAERNFSRVNAIDGRNADAYAFRSLIALNRHDLAGATRFAARGLDSSKSNALVHLAQGHVFMQSNKPDAAKTSGASAVKYNPSLAAAKTLIGEADGRLKDDVEARRLLTTVLLNDPLYREAKRVLYKYQL